MGEEAGEGEAATTSPAAVPAQAPNPSQVMLVGDGYLGAGFSHCCFIIGPREAGHCRSKYSVFLVLGLLAAQVTSRVLHSIV